MVTFLLFKAIFTLTGYFFILPLVLSTSFSVWCWYSFGEGDYSKFKPSGKYRVGYREFKTQQLGNDCSVFYPAKDDGSGEFEVPFLPHGINHVNGLLKVVSQKYPSFFYLAKVTLQSLMSVRIPVYRNANIGLDKMQPVIFSHGNSG